ncbi:MAG TPA: hypothetical protein DEP53_18540 [Bacteroidetes bacterium]|nr:hypothetical protein [Bacteroidota bacterium]
MLTGRIQTLSFSLPWWLTSPARFEHEKNGSIACFSRCVLALARSLPYVSYTDSRRNEKRWLFDGFLFIEFKDNRGF